MTGLKFNVKPVTIHGTQYRLLCVWVSDALSVPAFYNLHMTSLWQDYAYCSPI